MINVAKYLICKHQVEMGSQPQIGGIDQKNINSILPISRTTFAQSRPRPFIEFIRFSIDNKINVHCFNLFLKIMISLLISMV